MAVRFRWRGAPLLLQQQPGACCRGCTWALTWPGRWDRAPGRSSSCNIACIAQLRCRTEGDPSNFVPGTCVAALPPPQKLLYSLSTCLRRWYCHCSTVQAGRKVQDVWPYGTGIIVRALLSVVSASTAHQAFHHTESWPMQPG